MPNRPKSNTLGHNSQSTALFPGLSPRQAIKAWEISLGTRLPLEQVQSSTGDFICIYKYVNMRINGRNQAEEWASQVPPEALNEIEMCLPFDFTMSTF